MFRWRRNTYVISNWPVLAKREHIYMHNRCDVYTLEAMPTLQNKIRKKMELAFIGIGKKKMRK